jgi:steroid 5-alpha reductase family enzyme
MVLARTSSIQTSTNPFTSFSTTFGFFKETNRFMTTKQIDTVKIIAVYVAAILSALFTLQNYPTGKTLIDLLAADITATMVVYAGGVMLKNASVYDPYWSVAPILFLGFWYAHENELTIRSIIVSTLVVIWGVRLTYNWYRGWKDLTHEDWRYIQLKNQTKYFYPFVNLLGIHLFPTVLVFVASVPLATIFSNTNALGWLDFLAIFITGMAIYIEAKADKELFEFRKTKQSKQLLETGLWAYSRHPNYFGETLFWVGIFVFGLASGGSFWPLILGPILMLFLFLVVSIPLIDKRMISRYPEYEKRIKTVSRFFMWPKKS